jgi:hypothetical protein
MLLCCLRRTLKPSASATCISKLYQHFRERGLPCGLQDSLPTLNPSCSLPKNAKQLRHGSKARYGWVANPYRKPLLSFLPAGTFTLQDTPSLPRRDLAVGMPVTQHPPRRPGRAVFPHPVPRLYSLPRKASALCKYPMLSVDHYQFWLGNSQLVNGIAECLPGEAPALAASSVQPFK